jgi:hypothetical protein
LNYASIGGDVGGSFSRLRRGPTPLSAFAPGAHGQLALTADGGATWGVASVSTSSDLVDTSWPDLKTGYAIDAKGGLFRSANSGVSWSTLSSGAGAPARAVLALPGDVVLLVGPRGVKRATGGGEFNAVEGALVGRTALDDVQLAGPAIFASGRGGKGAARQHHEGRVVAGGQAADEEDAHPQRVVQRQAAQGHLTQGQGQGHDQRQARGRRRRRARDGLRACDHRHGLDEPHGHRGRQRRLVLGDVHDQARGRLRRPVGRRQRARRRRIQAAARQVPLTATAAWECRRPSA